MGRHCEASGRHRRALWRCFGEVLTPSQGTEELWAVIFCPPRCSELHSVQWGHLFSGVCGIRCRQCSPLFWHLQNSVPERAFSGTEYACRAQKGFLRYATRFLKPSVLKTGFWGTEGIFGTGNALLRYGTHLQRPAEQPTPQTVDSLLCTECIFSTKNNLLLHRTHFQRRRTASCHPECTFGHPAVLKPFHNSIQNGNH